MTDSTATCSPDAGAGPDERRAIDVDFDVTPPSIAIVSAIAEFEEVSPNDLEFVLHDHVDGDALDRLLEGGRDGQLEIHCRVDDYHVCVGRDGTVAVAPAR